MQSDAGYQKLLGNKLIVFGAIYYVCEVIIKFYVTTFHEYSVNTGIAFGLLNGNPKLAFGLNLLGVFGFVYIFARNSRFFLSKTEFICYVLIFFSILSNITDRIIFGGVVDYLKISKLPEANISDYTIVFCILFLIAINSYNNVNQRSEKIKPR